MRRIGLVITNIILLLALLCPARLLAQDQNEDPFVEQLLSQMSVEEKVGQLFLVTFVGNDLSEESDIVELVTQYHVGGVVLLAANENFTNNEDTPRQVAELTRKLQEWAFVASQPPQASNEGTATPTPTQTGQFIPLFIAVDHEGDGYPYTRITGGVTALPNNMALGRPGKKAMPRPSARLWVRNWRQWASICSLAPRWTCWIIRVPVCAATWVRAASAAIPTG